MAPLEALLVLLRERLGTLVEAMPAAQAGDVVSVHQARVATRRLRETLPVIRASTDAAGLRRTARQVRRVTRALGLVRELDVALAQLEALAARQVVSPVAFAAVRQALAAERLARRRAMLATLTPGRLAKLRARLSALAQPAEPPDPAGALEHASRQVVRRARRLSAAVERAGGLYLPDRLHAVRIAAKKLRYALEIQRELKRSRAAARLAQLKRLQDLLGRMHDAEMLIERVRAVQTELANRDRVLTSELDALVRTLEADCRREHAAYMRRRPALLQLCESLSQDAPARSSSAVA